MAAPAFPPEPDRRLRPFDAEREVAQAILSDRLEGIDTPPDEAAALLAYARGQISRAQYLRRCGVVSHTVDG